MVVVLILMASCLRSHGLPSPHYEVSEYLHLQQVQILVIVDRSSLAHEMVSMPSINKS